jgi:hypothetical protein
MRVSLSLWAIMFVLLAPGHASAEAPKSKAWRNASWGMTPEQVVSAFKGEAVSRDGSSYYDNQDAYIYAQIEHYTIGEAQYRVDFGFGKDRKLKAIFIQGPCSSAGELDRRFQELESLLIDKYGQPAVKQEVKHSWNTKVATISLESLSLSMIKEYQVTVVYGPPRPVADKL